MIRESFARELQRLKDAILMMGSEVEVNLQRAVTALTSRNYELAQELIRADEWFNERRFEIGREAMIAIATQQPAASDMRLIAAVMEIAGELERIHDYVKGIARISLMLEEADLPPSLGRHLPDMAAQTQLMLRRALDAFTGCDAGLARSVPEADDGVDALYNQTYQAIINHLLSHPQDIEHAHHLEWAAHNLERSADRVTNICEWVVYMVTGRFVELA